jgi:hypothetical protein
MNSYNECKEIVELDLDPIKVKLMHKESGEGWTLVQASAVEAEYRRYLYLVKIFPNEMAAPSMNVDTFWHYHILDTMKYAQDCEEIFGYFLHHFPYVGLRGEDDLVAHHQAGERMAVLYEETFGEKYWPSLIEAGGTSGTVPSTNNDATAFSIRPATAFSIRTTTAFSIRPSTAFSIRATTAFSIRATAADGSKHVKQDETGFLIHSEGTEISTGSAATVTDRDIAMNSFFLTRPRLPVQANAN